MSVGSYLRGARESRQLTLREVAEITKINRQLLADLENDDLRHWPKHRVYRHGYLRSYAIAVGLDPKKVLEKFDDEFGDPHPAAFHEGRSPANSAAGPVRVLRTGLQIATLLVFTGAAMNVFDPFDENSETRPSTRSVASQNTASLQHALEPAAVPSGDVKAPEDGKPTEQQMVIDVEGELRIISSPSQAHVTVNGIGRGKTPLRVRYLPLGSYRIRVVHPDYRIREASVTLGPEQPARTVRVVLRDSPASLNATLR
jgi:cytoskeletal protein RodZ